MRVRTRGWLNWSVGNEWLDVVRWEAPNECGTIRTAAGPRDRNYNRWLINRAFDSRMEKLSLAPGSYWLARYLFKAFPSVVDIIATDDVSARERNSSSIAALISATQEENHGGCLMVLKLKRGSCKNCHLANSRASVSWRGIVCSGSASGYTISRRFPADLPEPVPQATRHTYL